MVLFIFVVMMLNVGLQEEVENKWLTPRKFLIPSLLAAILLVLFMIALKDFRFENHPAITVPPKEVGISLFTTYLIAVELSAILLLAGIVGAYHLGKQKKKVTHRFLVKQPKINK
jgi:NADH-quinone oxidoreductase subunit J